MVWRRIRLVMGVRMGLRVEGSGLVGQVERDRLGLEVGGCLDCYYICIIEVNGLTNLLTKKTVTVLKQL